MATKTRRFQAIGTQKKHEVFEILQQDHATVKDLLMRLEKASEQESEQLLEQIERELTNHTEIEQELIYPAFKDSAQNDKDRKMYYESLEQHATVETVLLKLRAAESPDAFFARAKVLRDLVETPHRRGGRRPLPARPQADPVRAAGRSGAEDQGDALACRGGRRRRRDGRRGERLTAAP